MEPACSKSIVLKDGEHRLEKVGLLEWGCSKTVVNLNILNLCYLLGRLHGVTIYGFLVANCELSAERCLDSLPRISWWHWICWISATAEVSSAMFQLLNLVTWLSWLPMATLNTMLLPLAWFMYVHVIFPRTSKYHRITEYQIAHGDFPASWCSDHAHACLVPQGDLRTSSPGGGAELQGLQGFWWTVFLLGLAPSPPCFWFLDR